jgi:hypothetical protein
MIAIVTIQAQEHADQSVGAHHWRGEMKWKDLRPFLLILGVIVAFYALVLVFGFQR